MTNIHRVLIVDDEPLARERVAEFIHAVAPAVQTDEAADGNIAVELIRSARPDVVFLDVQMPGRDGFGVLRAIGTDAMPPTVFVTAFDQHAIRAFEVAAVDYLLKPFDEERFRAAWDRVAAHRYADALLDESRRFAALVEQVGAHATTAPAHRPSTASAPIDRIAVKKNQRTILVKLADVEWIESAGNFVTLHVGRETHKVRETLTAIEARLDPRRFVRVHRRTIVAIDAIREIQPWFAGDQVLILLTGAQIRVSRSYRDHVARSLAGTP